MEDQLKKGKVAQNAESLTPMTSNEQVWCTIVNNITIEGSTGDLTLAQFPNPPEYGSFIPGDSSCDPNPTPTIYGSGSNNYSASGQLAFICKGSRLMAGATGYVAYNLPETGGQLIIMFNSPYSVDGSGGPNNSYVYALIQPSGTDSSPTSYYAEVTGINMQLDPPLEQEVLTVTVTVNNAPSSSSTVR